MWGRLKSHWKFTTFLFVVGLIELIIVILYLSIGLTQRASVPNVHLSSHPVFDVNPAQPLSVEVKQPAFPQIFNEESGIEKRLPKLLHDYFKEAEGADFSHPELVGLLNFEMGHVKQFTLQKDTIVLHVNPRQLASDEGVKSISIKKDLLVHELKDEYKKVGNDGRIAEPDYDITTQPKPGNAINPQEKMLALTFDDGPDGNTHALLDALDKYEANATFFVLGQKVAGGEGVLQRMIREGHEIGNHSWNHPDLRKLSPQHIHSQIADTQNAIKLATGVTPTQMRPPYGAINSVVEDAVQSQGLHVAMWSVDTNDWRDRDPELLYQRIMSGAGDGKIILLHDIHPASVRAAIRAIPDLKAQGYQLVTITQQKIYR